MKELITLVQPAFDWTWKNSVQVALLIGLVLLVQKVLGRWLTPRLRYALSLLILFRLLLPAAPPSTMSLQNLFTPPARLATGEAVGSVVAEPAGPITSMAAEPIPASSAATSNRPPTLSVAEALGLAWACGLLTLGSFAGWRYVRWCRLIRQGRRLSDTRLLTLLDGAREAMGVRRPVTMVALARLSSPAVFGFWRVRLLLPEDALGQLTDQDLRLLFLHEMAHVRRQDMLLNLLLMAVQFVHWFNPLVWVGLHRLRADHELVCDAMVLQRTKPEERSNYGGLLLKLLGDFPAAQPMIPTAVPLLSSKAELRRRMVLIRHHRRSSLAVRLATTLVAVGLACSTFTGSSEQQRAQPAEDVAGVNRISPNHIGQGQTNQSGPVNISRATEIGAGMQIQGRPLASWLADVNTERGLLDADPALDVLVSAGPTVLPHLAEILRRDLSTTQQAKAADVIGVIAYRNRGVPEIPGVVPALASGAENMNARVRRLAVQALGSVGRTASNAIPVLSRCTKDEDEWVRKCAVEALRRIGIPTSQALEALQGSLSDPDGTVQIFAVQALYEFGKPATNAVPLLIQLTKNTDVGVRCHAIQILGQVGTNHPEAVLALKSALNDESEMFVRPLAREALKKLEAKGTTTFSETNAGSPATYTGQPTKVAPLGVFPGTPQPITTVPLTNIDPRPTYTRQSTKAAPHAVALTANQISARGLEGEFIRKPGQYHLDDGRSILTITGLTSDSWSLKVTWRSEKRTATGGLEKTEASDAPPRCLRAKGWFVFVETPERIWVYDGLDSGTLLMHSEKEMGSAAFSPELMASCPEKVWNAFPKGFQENNLKHRKVDALAFNAQVVLSFGRAGQGATSTTALLNSVRSVTNRHDLPGGTLEFFCCYEGQRRGKDIWTVGEKYPVGGLNETLVTKRIEYEGKRVGVRLNKDDSVVIEPRYRPVPSPLHYTWVRNTNGTLTVQVPTDLPSSTNGMPAKNK